MQIITGECAVDTTDFVICIYSSYVLISNCRQMDRWHRAMIL